ncbi:MAG TPA: OsmC family protein [Acetobacteraceae bacterium]|nr:OsmC family protein [Acetobacteraceae bacterium]
MSIDRTKDHTYTVTVTWTGNTGQGTASYRAYERAHEVVVHGKPVIGGSSDPAFRGDRTRYNPEEMLVASLSTCHMLWYLHLCSTEGIAVQAYQDIAEGVMLEQEDGSGRFREVVLQPEITVPAGTDLARARALHEEANRKCFIANSVNFPIRHEPVFVEA